MRSLITGLLSLWIIGGEWKRGRRVQQIILYYRLTIGIGMWEVKSMLAEIQMKKEEEQKQRNMKLQAESQAQEN